ncbi:MAG: putative ABC transport system ATP-binding protein [Flavobacteriaceae bacterium]|jgi:putative ABC transport system ATP-binding protein
MIQVKNIKKNYTNGNITNHVLKGIDIEIPDGQFVAIMGKSGAGKSTLLYQMSLLDEPTEGVILIDGDDVHGLTSDEKSQYRLENLGYVFQDYALLPELSAMENAFLPLLMKNVSTADAEKKIKEVFHSLELSGKEDSLPSQLSGGEQQRVSIARGVAGNPRILFADEPTANLDSVSSLAVIDTLSQLHKQGQTIVMVTHEREYAQYAERILYMEDGLITKDEMVK